VSVLAAAFATTLFALAFPIEVDWTGLAIFGVIVLLAEVLSVEVYVKDTAVSTSASAMIAGYIYFGPAGVLVLSLVQAGSAMVKFRSQPKRFFFNLGNQIFAGMLGFLMVRLVLGNFDAQPILAEVFGTLLVAGIVYVVTTMLLSLVIFLSSGEAPVRVWNERFRWLAMFYLTMGLVSFAFIYSYRLSGLVGVLIVLGPLMMLRLSQKEYLDRTTESVKQLRSSLDELRKRSEEISRLNDTLLHSLSRVIDARDPYTLDHSQNVSRYAASIAQRMGMPIERVELVRKAALLHDIGKLGIPEAILWKVGELSPREYEQLKRHPKMGSVIIGDIPALRSIIPAVLHHHERFDGKGYPNGLAGEAIPLEARILSVADASDAMSSNRPYRKKYERHEVLEELRKNAGTQFDPTIVKVFLSILAAEGSLVPPEPAPGPEPESVELAQQLAAG
jgi:putative nucleotidyltransferase with HDIG domain